MRLRKPLMAGNWKMHKTHIEAIATVQKLHFLLSREDYERVEVAVFPPFTALRSVQVLLESDRIPIYLGAQDIFWEEEGAFTGEVSGRMLAALGVRYVLVGHSERRHLLGEDDGVVAKKLRAAVRTGLTPILCVGERIEEREAGRTWEVVGRQVEAAMAGLEGETRGLVVAYEPVWAIGTGRTATPDDASQASEIIRSRLGELLGEAAREEVRVLYGGSVNSGNIGMFMAAKGVDGALVGGASLDPEEFARIVRYR